jgi:hypothetical protein
LAGTTVIARLDNEFATIPEHCPHSFQRPKHLALLRV